MKSDVSPLREHLASRFAPVADADWLERLAKDLKTDAPLERLKVSLGQDLTVPSVLRRSERLDPLPPSSTQILDWVEPANDLTAILKESWANDADGVVLSADVGTASGLSEALAAAPSGLSIHLDPGEAGLELLERHASAFETVRWDPVARELAGGKWQPKTSATALGWRCVDAVRLADAGADVATCLTYTFLRAAELLASDDDSDLLVAFPVFGELFPALAALRAARIGLGRIEAVLGMEKRHRLRAQPTRWSWSPSDPPMNLLRATVAAVSGFIAGVDEITLPPHASGHPDSRRWSRNILHMARQEAHLDQISDPAAGSHLVETMTRTIGDRSWAEFHAIHEHGGLAAPAHRSALRERVLESAAQDRQSVREGRTVVVGTNRFSDPGADVPSSGHAHKAADVQRIRQTLKSVRTLPFTQLSESPDALARRARLADLVATAGVTLEQADHARLLCGSDEDYRTVAPARAASSIAWAPPGADVATRFKSVLNEATTLDEHFASLILSLSQPFETR